MVRTQIQLTEQQAKAVKTMSNVHGISTAEVIRRAINLLLESSYIAEEGETRARALKIVGRFCSGRQNISKNHDTYLAEGYQT